MEENTNVTDGAMTGTDNATDTGNAQGQDSGEETPKTYTAEELQAESNRRVTEALKTASAKAPNIRRKGLSLRRQKFWPKRNIP